MSSNSPAFRKSSADKNSATLNPMELMSVLIAWRIDASSSTTEICVFLASVLFSRISFLAFLECTRTLFQKLTGTDYLVCDRITIAMSGNGVGTYGSAIGENSNVLVCRAD